MESIDLSTNSKEIEQAYNKLVKGDRSINYLVLTVDKGSVVKVSETGDGPLSEFVEQFEDGQVQFGLSRTKAPGSEVSKNILVGWCPDNAPSRARLSFASNFADVARVLTGYHVQITARDQDDLNADELIQRVSAAAGAGYSSGYVTSKPASSTPAVAVARPKAPTLPKPSYIPKSTGNPINSGLSKPSLDGAKKVTESFPAKDEEDDEWGGEGEIKERDFEQEPLENVPSSYKPTKVNITELRGQKSDTVTSTPKPSSLHAEVNGEENENPGPLKDRIQQYQKNEEPSNGRLTSLPKPKISNVVNARFKPVEHSSGPTFGAKPSFGINDQSKKSIKISGDFSRNYASENGKSPAQLWAEKRGKYKVVSPEESEDKDIAKSFENKVSLDNQSDKDADGYGRDEDAQSPISEPSVIKPSSFSTVSSEAPNPVNVISTSRTNTKSGSSSPPPLPMRNSTEDVIKENKAQDDEAKYKKQYEAVETSDEAPSLPARNLSPISHTTAAKDEKTRHSVAAPPLPSKGVNDNKSAGSIVSATAEYDYTKDEDNEISFTEGDLIVEIDFVDEEWWSGKHSNTEEVGLFPAAYVTLNETTDKNDFSESKENSVEDKNSDSLKPSATAEYDYEEEEDNEITFAEGDLIEEIEFLDDDWWSGKHVKTGKTGLFPGNYVSLNN